jgi:protein O-mannosyl-transferase
LKRHKFIPVLIIAAGLWAYHNSFHGPFIFDDLSSIPMNPHIRHLWPIREAMSASPQCTITGRPVVTLTLGLNYALDGLNVRGYHAVNLAIHLAAGLVLFGVVRRTLLQPPLRQHFGAAALPLALLIAVIWVVHPLQTEAVTYIVQRAESLMGLFYLLTLYCVIRGAESDSSKLWYGLSFGSCLLGMASKEVMASAPLIVLLYDRAFIAGSFREAWQRRRALYLGLGATWICLAYLVMSTGRFGATSANTESEGITWWAYLLTEPGVILHYLRLSVWPQPLCFDYLGWPVPGAWPSILPSVVVMVALLGATVWVWRTDSIPLGTGPAWGFPGAWFFLILAPTSSLVPMDSPAYEHHMYLPLAAVVAVLVLGAFEIGKRLFSKHQGVVLGCVASASAVGLFTFLTIQRNQVYKSAVSIWQDVVQKRPNNPRAHNHLAVALVQLGRLEEAAEHWEQALRLQPDDAFVHYNLGVTLFMQGKVQEGLEHWERALRLEPGDAGWHKALGDALAQAGKLPEAIEHWQEAVRIKPDFAEAHSNLGLALVELGRLPEAISQYDQVLRIKPDDAGAHFNLGNALCQAGQVPEAIGHYEHALRIKPEYPDAHINLGAALMGQGRLQEAISQYEQALQIKPDSVEAQIDLGNALRQAGRLPDAISYYEQALRIRPDNANAHGSLGNALVQAGRVPEAIEHWQRALQINPDLAETHYNLGATLEKLGRTQEAIQHYEESLRIKPDFVQARDALARALAVR